MPVLDVEPYECTPGRQETLSCGPCMQGTGTRICQDDGHWGEIERCSDPYDVYDEDDDGFVGASCLALAPEPTCCGIIDCDDSNPWRGPENRNVDGDEFDAEACGGTDCNDDDPERWSGHADLDGDGHDDVGCGGDDCDDEDPRRWLGDRDLDGDGQIAASCCLPDEECGDCNDDDPLRWSARADLDGDGHDDLACGGDDCNDEDPYRWLGHADLDGDGHTHFRCCLSGDVCDDCNDDDPERWSGHADRDGDGFVELQCCRYQGFAIEECDCDDNTSSSSPDVPPSVWESALDRDCDGLVDSISVPRPCEPMRPVIMGTVTTVGDAQDVSVVRGAINSVSAFVASVDGLYKVRVHHEEGTEYVVFTVMERAITGAAWGVMTFGENVYVAANNGLFVLSTEFPASDEELVLVAGPLWMNRAHSVFVSRNYAYVATATGLTVVDVTTPWSPWIVSSGGDPARRARFMDVFVTGETAVVAAQSDDRGRAGGMYLIDVSRPESLEPVPAVATDQLANGVFVQGSTAFVAMDDGLEIWDIGNPTEPSLLSTAGTGYSQDVFVVGHHALVAGEHGLCVVDVSELSSPVDPDTNDCTHGPMARGIYYLDELAYLATEVGLQVVDLNCDDD